MNPFDSYIAHSMDQTKAVYAWLNTYWGLRLIDAFAVALILTCVVLNT